MNHENPSPVNDAKSLANFVLENRLQLLTFIDRRLGAALEKKVEPDDIFQEMSLEAVRRIHEIGEVQRDIFGWLCQIAEHRIIDAHRRFFATEKRAAEREVALQSPISESRAIVDLLAASFTSPSQAFSRDQKEIAVQAAMQELPAECQEALRLRYVEGLASKEIAKRLGKTDGAIRVLLTRSLQKLQKLLENY